MANPYESPTEASYQPPERGTSAARGLAYGVPLAVLGLLVPSATLAGLTRCGLIDMEWREIPGKVQWSSIACALLFGWSAIANFSPPKGIGFIRSLLVMGLATIGALVGMAVLAVVFLLGPRTYTSDPFEWLRWVLFLGGISAAGLAFTVWQIQSVWRREAAEAMKKDDQKQ
jgi:hypothetical protein